MGSNAINYFPFMCQDSEAFELIEAEFGLKTGSVIVKLYQKIFGQLGYYCVWNKEVQLLFSTRNCFLQPGDNCVSEIVQAAVKRGIFDEGMYKKYGILTSKWIQETFFTVTKRRTDVEVEKSYLLVEVAQIPKNVRINGENVCRNEKNAYRNGQRKVKESKVNKIKENNKGVPPLWYPNDEKLNQTLSDFIEFRKGIKAEMADHSIELLIKRLDSMTSVSNEKIQILEQSMINGWKGIFPLDKSSTPNKSAPKVNKTKFTNYEEREWDYEELERIKQAELMKGVNAENA